MKVKVKWNKENYDVDIDTNEDPMVFKAQLFALTGVAPERQKVMFKGAILKDSWAAMKLKDGAQILMMGTAGELPSAPVQKTVFVEDMDENEIASALNLPIGLANMGNTCYMNAVVQCLKTVPDLVEALVKYNHSIDMSGSNSRNVTAALRGLYSCMESDYEPGKLTLLHLMLVKAIPRFGERSPESGMVNAQQDANECWTEMLRFLQQELPPKPSATLQEGEGSTGAGPSTRHSSVITQLFGGKLDCTLKCTESEAELETQTTEDFLQLSCFIDQDIKYLIAGIKSRMNEQIEKRSPTLDRNAIYSKCSKISRLPAYLTVNLVRFFFKGKEGVGAKMLRDVKFPMMLDVFELCSPDLQEKLLPMRNKFKEWEDTQATTRLQDGDKKDNTAGAATAEAPLAPVSFEDDYGSNNSGFYQLQAVLTHKGRSSSSGHYVAWIRKNKDEWFKCDDDTVSPVHAEEILKLSGGGDWHTAYVLLYGPRILGRD